METVKDETMVIENAITDRAQIEKVLRAYLLNPNYNKKLIAIVRLKPGAKWAGRSRRNGVIINGPRVLSCNSTDTETIFTFTNSDVSYLAPIGSASLADIQYVQLSQ